MCPGLLVCTRNEPIGLMIKKKQINSEFMILLIKNKLLMFTGYLLDNFRVIAES